MKDNEIEALFIVESRIFEVIKKFDENYDRWQKSDPEGDDDNGYEVCAHMSDVYAARVGHAVMRDIREAHYHKNKYHAEAKEEKGMPRFCEHCDTCVCDFCWHCQKELDDDGAATGLGYCHSHMEFMSLGSGSGCDDFDCFNNHEGEDRPWMKEEVGE